MIATAPTRNTPSPIRSSALRPEKSPRILTRVRSMAKADKVATATSRNWRWRRVHSEGIPFNRREERPSPDPFCRALPMTSKRHCHKKALEFGADPKAQSLVSTESVDAST